MMPRQPALRPGNLIDSGGATVVEFLPWRWNDNRAFAIVVEAPYVVVAIIERTHDGTDWTILTRTIVDGVRTAIGDMEARYKELAASAS